eukprot:853316-Pyramimonas_sp.AAC.1
MAPPMMARWIAPSFPSLMTLSALHESPSLAARRTVARRNGEVRDFVVSEFALDPLGKAAGVAR